MEIEEWVDNNQLSIDIWNKKYKFEDESFEEWLDRISGNDLEIRRLIKEKKFIFGGRILANRGTNDRRKISLNNCYVLAPPEDNIESIYDTAKHMARTFSYSGGVGISLDKIAPKGAKVNNAAKSSSGVVSFCELYNTTGEVIGAEGRRSALMLSLSSEHPDIEEFVDAKTDITKLTKCNMSVTASDDFMHTVYDNAITWGDHTELYKTSFVREAGEVIEKEINPNELFYKIAYNNWSTGEPGLVYMDRIKSWTMLSNHPEFAFSGLNPCGEMPLPSYGACCLSSANLSAYVKQQDDPGKYYFDMDIFRNDIPTFVRAMNEVLDEGLPLHPLKEQTETVQKWRQIGIGICGWHSALMKLHIKYGSDESIQLAKDIAETLLNESFLASVYLAEEYGTYPAYNYDYLKKSKFYNENIWASYKLEAEKYGLRNSQLLSIAPTGSISLLLGVSQSSEPIYNISYNRKTESLNGGTVSYKMYDPTVAQIMKELDITEEKDLPDYIITSQEIPYLDRIKMQATWQQYIDASISSTINLPNKSTPDDIFDLYIEAWKAGLKGVTVFRDGCARAGILTTDATPSVPTSTELKRGDWKPLAEDTVGSKKIKIKTGCGELIVFPQWSPSERKLQEVWVKKIGTGGCERSIDAIAIEMSGILRLGGSLENVKKSFEKLGVCQSFKDARKAGRQLSNGNSCADCILKALQKYESEMLVEDKVEDTRCDNTLIVNACPECGSELIFTGGCNTCNICGFSKCG